ncbi:MAG: FAD:protein FMN transferase [Planctomycetota bacterium]
MGTSARVIVYSATPDDAERASRAAYAEVAAVDAAMSDWSETSELSRLNREGVLVVSPPLFEVIDAAVRFARLTDGAFDPTVGPVTALWRRGEAPSPTDLEEARRLVDWRRVSGDPATRRVVLRPGTRIDLGGIAKGYAAERALRAIGDMPAMVELGGDLALGAPPPGGDGWRIALVDGRALTVSRCHVSTSGDMERHLDADGVRYSHIVDPATGIGLVGSPVVLVLACEGMTADVLSTAASVGGLGEVGGWEGAEGIAIHPDGRVEETPGFRRLLVR